MYYYERHYLIGSFFYLIELFHSRKYSSQIVYPNNNKFELKWAEKGNKEKLMYELFNESQIWKWHTTIIILK